MKPFDRVLMGGAATVVPLVLIAAGVLVVMRLPIDPLLQTGVAVWIAIPFTNSINTSHTELKKWQGSRRDFMKAFAESQALALLAAVTVAGAILIFPAKTRVGGIAATGIGLLVFVALLVISRRRERSQDVLRLYGPVSGVCGQESSG